MTVLQRVCDCDGFGPPNNCPLKALTPETDELEDPDAGFGRTDVTVS